MTQQDRITVRNYLSLIQPYLDTEKIRKGQYPKAINILSDMELKALASFDTSEIYRIIEVFKALYRHIMLEVTAHMGKGQWEDKALYLAQVSGVDLVLKLPLLAKKELEERAKNKLKRK